MKRTTINLAKDKARGIEALKGTGVPAVFSDAVRIDLPGCALLYISGKVGTDDTGKVVGRTMREQTERVLSSIQAILQREGGTMEDIVRVRVYVTQLDQQSLQGRSRSAGALLPGGHVPGKYARPGGPAHS